jgi:hypothetical protein
MSNSNEESGVSSLYWEQESAPALTDAYASSPVYPHTSGLSVVQTRHRRSYD